MNDLSELTFIQLKYAQLIPRELIDSVKGKTFTVEEFYSFQKRQKDNPLNHLYALIDPVKKIHGFIWAQSNLLDNTLFVNTFSISKAYWGKGEAIGLAIEFLRKLRVSIKAPRVFWISSNEKFFVKHGFKRSKNVLMEYNQE